MKENQIYLNKAKDDLVILEVLAKNIAVNLYRAEQTNLSTDAVDIRDNASQLLIKLNNS